MDVLSEILSAVKLKGSLYFRTEFSPPWGLRVPAMESVARFHVLTRGVGYVRITGVEGALRMEAGDLIVIAHGAEHVLSDQPDTPCRTVDDVVRESGFTGEGALVHGGPDRSSPACFVCGHFTFDPFAGKILIASLPKYVLVRGFEPSGSGWIDAAMKYIAAEAAEASPGAEAIIQRLSEILFIQTVRRHASTAEVGFLSVLRDPQISRALSAFHADPARDWTVESLAQEAGLSRTIFAERMRNRLGIPPMQYVTQWRMDIAARKLISRNSKLPKVAASVGYQSSGAFIRAFKKQFGEGPGRFRKKFLQKSR